MQLKKLTLSCKFCKISFNTTRSTATYCSRSCLYKSRTTLFLKQCEYCYENFLPTNSATIYCSRKCSANTKSKKVQISCKVCNVLFTVMNYMRAKTVFCSRKCAGAGKQKKQKLKEKHTKICNTCNNLFSVWNYRNNAKFCSQICKINNGRHHGVCRRCNESFFEEKNIVKTSIIRKFYCAPCALLVPSCHRSGFQLDVYETLLNKLPSAKIIHNQYIKVQNRKIWPDIQINSSIIIECQGDYYHCNPALYNALYFHKKQNRYAYEIWEKDNNRVAFLEQNGYTVVQIWEADWKQNKELTINTAIQKIYEIQKNNKN